MDAGSSANSFLGRAGNRLKYAAVVIKDVPGAYGVVKESKGGRPSAIVHSQELTIQALRVGLSDRDERVRVFRQKLMESQYRLEAAEAEKDRLGRELSYQDDADRQRLYADLMRAEEEVGMSRIEVETLLQQRAAFLERFQSLEAQRDEQRLENKGLGLQVEALQNKAVATAEELRRSDKEKQELLARVAACERQMAEQQAEISGLKKENSFLRKTLVNTRDKLKIAEEIADTYEAEAKDLLNGSKYFHFMDSMSFFTKKLKRVGDFAAAQTAARGAAELKARQERHELTTKLNHETQWKDFMGELAVKADTEKKGATERAEKAEKNIEDLSLKLQEASVEVKTANKDTEALRVRLKEAMARVVELQAVKSCTKCMGQARMEHDVQHLGKHARHAEDEDEDELLVAAAEDLAVRQLASPVAVLSAHPVIVSSASPVPDRGHASRCA